MPVGKRLHLSYERMVLLADSAPAFKTQPSVAVRTISRIQDVSYSFDYGAMQLKEIGSSEFIKDRTPALNSDPMKSRIPIVVQPTVTLEFSYLFFDAKNEENLGAVDRDLLPENSINLTFPQVVKKVCNF